MCISPSSVPTCARPRGTTPATSSTAITTRTAGLTTASRREDLGVSLNVAGRIGVDNQGQMVRIGVDSHGEIGRMDILGE